MCSSDLLSVPEKLGVSVPIGVGETVGVDVVVALGVWEGLADVEESDVWLGVLVGEVVGVTLNVTEILTVLVDVELMLPLGVKVTVAVDSLSLGEEELPLSLIEGVSEKLGEANDDDVPVAVADTL